MVRFFKQVRDRVKLYIQITQIGGITRRYFVMNSFDGSMTMLGIILGSWMLKVENPNLVVMMGLGTCLALGVSGFFSAYVSEMAECKRRLKTLESSLLSNLDDSIYKDAFKFAAIFVALVNGLAPALAAFTSLKPFFLTMLSILIIWDAYIISFALTFTVLFSLGAYLGKVARENVLIYGAHMLAAGITVILIILLLGGGT